MLTDAPGSLNIVTTQLLSTIWRACSPMRWDAPRHSLGVGGEVPGGAEGGAH